MRSFEYFEPRSLQEAAAMLVEKGAGARLLAGGTDLLVQMKHDLIRPNYVINLKSIPNLAGIAWEPGTPLRIGALTRICEVANHHGVREHYPALHQAARALASPLVRNRATIGGNLCNASPSADTAPALLIYEAVVKIVGPDGQRSVSLDQFFVGPGQNCLGQGEIVVEVELPARPPGARSIYVKHTIRKAHDIAIVGLAAIVSPATGAEIVESRIALGAVSPTPIRARKAEAALKGKKPGPELFQEVARLADGECQPISDLRSSAWYRRHIVQVVVERALAELFAPN